MTSEKGPTGAVGVAEMMRLSKRNASGERRSSKRSGVDGKTNLQRSGVDETKRFGSKCSCCVTWWKVLGDGRRRRRGRSVKVTSWSCRSWQKPTTWRCISRHLRE